MLNKAITPKGFVASVNNVMSSCYNFTPFELNDVKAYNVVSRVGKELTIYALVKPYGIFYVYVNSCEVFFEFQNEKKLKIKEIKFFRIYANSHNCSEDNIFYLLRLKRGQIYIQGVFCEYQDSEGCFKVAPFNEWKWNDKKFPIKIDSAKVINNLN